jgi:mRNA interferase HigB
VELLNAIELDRASRKHAQVGRWLQEWRTVVLAAHWRNLLDVKRTYQTAEGVVVGHGRTKRVVTVFNAGGNDFRLLTQIDYRQQLVQVGDVLTHGEYSKDKWKKRYD